MRPGSGGFALPTAVFALALIAALLAGVFFAAHQELRLGRNALAMERAFAAAEGGLHATLASWSPARFNTLGTAQAAPFAGALPAGTGAYTGTVIRLNRTLFLVRATGRDGGAFAQRTVSRVARLVPPPLDLQAALTVTGQLDLAPGSAVRGDDLAPAGWDCPPAASSPGVRIRDTTRISDAECPVASCVSGSPAVMADITLADSIARRDFETAWSQLSALAVRTYPAGSGPAATPVGTAASCDSSAADNWGEPRSPPLVEGCARYFPVVLGAGDLRVSGGSGQGVLLVDGDLIAEGGFQFRGVLLVRGTLTIQGLGARVLGAVEAGSVALRPSGPTGVAEIQYSGCVVRSVLLQNASAAPLAPRGWVGLY